MTEDEKRRQMAQLFDGHATEIITVLREYQTRVNDGNLLEVWTARNEAVAELVRQQRRMIDHLAGRPVAPETFSAEAVIFGEGSAG